MQKTIKKIHAKSNSKTHSKTHSKKNINNAIAISLSILSYNISWESMSGSVKSWALCNNNTNTTNSKHFSVCVNNIASVFDNNYNLDFITLQEASDYEKLIKQSTRLKQMKYELHKSGLDTIITFWDAKYNLKYKIQGEFEKGRPWMALVYSNGICMINVHMGHYSKDDELYMMDKMIANIKNGLKNGLKNGKDGKDGKGLKHDFKNIRFIVSGDFNYNIKEFGNAKNSFLLDKTRFYFNPKHILTCCINRRRHNDHIIDSFASPLTIEIPKVNYMSSDHKPILARIKY